jgi:hypothetical protein
VVAVGLETAVADAVAEALVTEVSAEVLLMVSAEIGSRARGIVRVEETGGFGMRGNELVGVVVLFLHLTLKIRIIIKSYISRCPVSSFQSLYYIIHEH